jgi:polysaccharide biosynthesis/export protein
MRLLCLFILLSFLSPLGISAQESLLIGPGDQLRISVFETPQLDEVARVTDNGEIPLIVGGNVKVASLTPTEASKAIEQALLNARVMRHPQVLVTIQQYATQNVTVSGQVAKPGSYEITTPRQVLDVLTLAGGLSDLADRHITIKRARDGSQETYFVSNDADELFRHGKLVYPGDSLLVPKAGIVYVLGDVGRPGGYSMSSNNSKLTALQAVAMAGGTAPSAAPGASRLIRRISDGYSTLPLPLSAMQKGKKPDQQLQSDDIIYVPFSYLRNAALGLTGIVSSATSAAIYTK